MSLAEVAALDVDVSPSSSLSLFVHCSRLSSSRRPQDSLQLQVLDGSSLFEAQVTPNQKPRALACSATEYVAAVETALSSFEKGDGPRLEFRWSREKRTLTFMEKAEFAMKFTVITFQRLEDEDKWRTLLRLVAQQQREDKEKFREKEERVKRLETLLKQKEKLLDTALMEKQRREDTLFEGFCAVLNAKKDEINRLQSEVERAQEVTSYEMKLDAKKKVPMGKRTRKTKLKKVEEEKDMSDGSSKESDNSTVTEEEEDEEIEKKRTKRDAVNAYSQVPALRSSSVQISSADDLLSSMDYIIKNEEEVDEAVLRGASSQGVKAEPVSIHSQSRAALMPRSGSRGKKTPAAKRESSPPRKPKSEPTKPSRLAPPVDKPMDSEEEDILDMLS